MEVEWKATLWRLALQVASAAFREDNEGNEDTGALVGDAITASLALPLPRAAFRWSVVRLRLASSFGMSILSVG